MADNSDFTHLHAHGEFSLLDGVGTIEHVVKSAKEKGFRALAQTDHGSVSGALKFVKECNKQQIKPIVGCEIYVVDDVSYRKPEGVKADREKLYHTIVLAKDWDGFVSLMNLLTKGHSEKGFYYKPRVGWDDVYQLKNCVVTTACIGGPFKHVDWKTKIQAYRDSFGEDFYIEVQPHNISEQHDLNRRAVQSANEMQVKLIASNDFHYAHSDECHAQEALLGIRNKQIESSEDKWDFTPGLYMRTFDDMLKAFSVLQSGNQGSNMTEPQIHQALLTTSEIVEKCNFKLPELGTNLPNVDTSELNTADPDLALVRLCMEGWKKRFPKMEFVSPQGKHYFERFQKEIKIIQRLKFSQYFLLVWDLYRFCNKNNIAYGPGRGSGAGSIVCYLLGITNADPIHYGLIFERFINPERIDLPDLDLDFEHERRDEIYRYMQQTYKNVAHIATYTGMNAKLVLKDVARFKQVPLEEVDEVNKEIEFNTPKQEKMGLTLKKVEANLTKYPLFAKFSEKNPAVIKIAKVLEGQVRQSSVHAGGVIVSSQPLTDRAVVEWRKGEPTINFDMYDINDLGLLKVDVLGSKTVSVLKYSKKLIDDQLEGKVLDFDGIPLNDPLTLKQFDIGETTGIFQFESDGIRNVLRQMAPHDIDTIITANAMYRPGPLQFKDKYVANKRNPSLIKSTGNEALDRITKETFGVFIYQEQVMRIAVDVAGYTYPEADALRKKISKSLGKEEVEKSREKFVKGCVEFGRLSSEAAETLFSQIVDFGRYCFNKSHSTTYSLISFYAMWLRTHWPCEFLTASIAYSSDGPKAKEDRSVLRKEAERLGIMYNKPHINSSDKLCSIERKDGKKQLRGGFNEVDGIGNAAIEVILKARLDKPFQNFPEFLSRLENKRIVNIGVQAKLLKAGLFDELHTAAEVRQMCDGLKTKTKTKSISNVTKDKPIKQEDEQQSLEWLLTALPQS